MTKLCNTLDRTKGNNCQKLQSTSIYIQYIQTKINKHMKETKNTKKTNEQKATTKLPKPKQLINKEKHKTKVV